MAIFRIPRSPFYHYDFQFKGVRFHGSTKETDLRAAQKFETEERDQAKQLHRRKILAQRNALPDDVDLKSIARELTLLRNEVRQLREALSAEQPLDQILQRPGHRREAH